MPVIKYHWWSSKIGNNKALEFAFEQSANQVQAFSCHAMAVLRKFPVPPALVSGAILASRDFTDEAASASGFVWTLNNFLYAHFRLNHSMKSLSHGSPSFQANVSSALVTVSYIDLCCLSRDSTAPCSWMKTREHIQYLLSILASNDTMYMDANSPVGDSNTATFPPSRQSYKACMNWSWMSYGE